MNAFNNDPARKRALIDAIRDRWTSGQLAPCAMLKWMPEQGFCSLNAALIEGEDTQRYEALTGIPVALALLCETMIAMAAVTTPDASKPLGIAIHVNPDTRRFGLEWLEAIRPGADLDGVLPTYMADYLAWFLSPEFALADHVEPAVRDAAERILAFWRQALDGAPVDDKAWRDVRKAAVRASEACGDPWCHNLAIAIESLAWPAQDIRAEFQQFFMVILGQLVSWLQQPYLDPDDQAGTVAMFESMHAITQAEAEGTLSQQDKEAIFHSRPEWSRALAGFQDPAVMERMRAAKLRAMEATDRPIRSLMDAMLRLLAAV